MIVYPNVGREIKIRRNGERFWVKVIKVSKCGIKGICLNDLLMNNFKYGDNITFKIKDIV
jgi:uncharacterized protein YegJ (DUF2314 family)